MTHPKLIFKRMQFPTIHFHTPRSRNALRKKLQIWTLQVIFESQQKHLFSKAYNLSMEYQNYMRPKGLVIGHLNISIKSKNTSKSAKLKKLCIVEVVNFCKIAKSQLSPKLQILSNGPIRFLLIWTCHITHMSQLRPCVHLSILLFYLIFY